MADYREIVSAPHAWCPQLGARYRAQRAAILHNEKQYKRMVFFAWIEG
jgi:hypothetical protein